MNLIHKNLQIETTDAKSAKKQDLILPNIVQEINVIDVETWDTLEGIA